MSRTTVSASVFDPDARAAIITVGLGRCIACGRPDVTCQHRRARMMGGSRDAALGDPRNGVPLCGSGTHGCHGWVEDNPIPGTALGYRLGAGDDVDAPFWHREYGWCAWTPDITFRTLDVTELDDPLVRALAVDELHAMLRTRAA